MTRTFTTSAWAASALALTAAFTPIPTAAQSGTASRFTQELAACRDGSSHQSRRDCEREAHAARSEARRGAQDTAVAPYAANALRRCEAFERDDRRDCEARMGAQARTDGSVNAGGLLRQATTPATPR